MMVKSPISQTDFCFQNAIMVRFPWSTCVQFSTQQKWYSSIYMGRMVILVDSVSINPVLPTIKLWKWFIVCQEAAVIPSVTWTLLSELHRPVRRQLIESIYWRLPNLWYLAWPGWSLKEDGNEIDSNFVQILLLHGNRSWSKDRAHSYQQKHKISMHISDPPTYVHNN